MAGEYGPVPISRLKDEVVRMSDALKQGRRVLISRQGRVVAQIEPASALRHADVLASFAVDAESAPRAISPTLLSQGAGSDAVHAAERGEVQLLTRNSKVLGVITNFLPSNDWATLMDREEAMQEVEHAFPDATPEQFQSVVARSSPSANPPDVDVSSRGDAGSTAMAVASSGAAALHGAAVPAVGAASTLVLGAVGAITAYRRAQFARATALRSLGDDQEAESALLHVIATIQKEPTPSDEGLAVRSYLALADLYNDADRPQEALDSAEHALEHLRSITSRVTA